MSNTDNINNLLIIAGRDNYPKIIIEAARKYGVKNIHVIAFKGETKKRNLNSNEHNKLVPKNTILFVALHELSHLMTETFGHGEDFWRNFRFILKVAIDKNIYKRVDFNNDPQKYCGMEITDTPY